MKVSRFGHFLRTVACAAPAVMVELLTTSPIGHLAWAPTALVVARWLRDEIGAAGATHDGP